MSETDYFWVEFKGMRIKARNESEAYSIVLKKLQDGDFPEIFIEQEFVTPLRAWPVHDENCDRER